MMVWILGGRTLGAPLGWSDHHNFTMVHIKYICFNRLSVFPDILHQIWVEIMIEILETFCHTFFFWLKIFIVMIFHFSFLTLQQSLPITHMYSVK